MVDALLGHAVDGDRGDAVAGVTYGHKASCVLVKMAVAPWAGVLSVNGRAVFSELIHAALHGVTQAVALGNRRRARPLKPLALRKASMVLRGIHARMPRNRS